MYWITILVLEHFYAFFVSPPLIQKNEVYWKLAVVVLFFFLWKIINRAATVYRLYGGLMAWLSMIRIFHGNLVNFFASVMAINWYIKYRISGKEPGWIQTEHQYPTDQDLQLFLRILGDLLLENQLVTSKQLEEALTVQKHSGGRFGKILVKTGHLKEQDLSDILGVQQESREKVSS